MQGVWHPRHEPQRTPGLFLNRGAAHGGEQFGELGDQLVCRTRAEAGEIGDNVHTAGDGAPPGTVNTSAFVVAGNRVTASVAAQDVLPVQCVELRRSC